MNDQQEEILIRLSENVDDILSTLKGTNILGQKSPGVIERLRSIEKKVDDHEVTDAKNFEAIFKFQENGMLLMGWSKKAIGFLITGLILLGGFMGWTITTIIALFA